jgi:glycosyltransferase involved in cell wall biosynthesis
MRLAESGRFLRLSWTALRPWLQHPRNEVWRNERIGWDRYERADFGSIKEDKSLKTTLLLKAPAAGGEKGVIYSSFEYNWMKLIASHSAQKIFDQYILVGASSWSPTDCAVFSSLSGLSRDPAFIGISNPADQELYKCFSPTIRPLSIMACDWINPAYYNPLPHCERQIDILMVAHWERWKRHWILFKALARMRSDLTVVLIGRDSGPRTAATVHEEAKAFGVRQNLVLLTNISIDEVIGHQCNAKVSIACSRREGSCVSVTESMFADSPVAMVDDSHIGAKAYINRETGILFRPKLAHLQLSEMLERSDAFSARNWAETSISASLTSRKLNGILRQYCENATLPWTRDIAPLCWHYVPDYLNVSDLDLLRPAVEEFNDRFDVTIKQQARVAMSRAASTGNGFIA